MYLPFSNEDFPVNQQLYGVEGSPPMLKKKKQNGIETNKQANYEKKFQQNK